MIADLLRSSACLALLANLTGCRPAKAPQNLGCAAIGRDTSEEAVKALYASKHAPLVVTENAVYLCGCGGRKIGGAEERAKIGGGTETTRLGGKVETNKLSGATETGKTGGATEKGQLAGATEVGKSGGATEAGKTGGVTEAGKTGGATERGQTGGATEQGKLGGDTERGKLGGDVEPLTCREVPTCLGFLVSGAGPIRTYASTGWSQPADRCINE